MADLKQLIDEFASVAELAAAVLPAAGIAGGTARIGSKLIEIIDDFGHHADSESTVKLEDAHRALVQAITAKSGSISQRLRGE